MVQRYPTPRSPPPARRSSSVSITSRSGSSSSKRHTQAEAATPSPHRRLDLVVRCPDPADMRPRRGESQTTEPGRNGCCCWSAAPILLPKCFTQGDQKRQRHHYQLLHKKKSYRRNTT